MIDNKPNMDFPLDGQYASGKGSSREKHSTDGAALTPTTSLTFGLDEDGYPTEETLQAIEKWRGDFKGFFYTLKPVWKYHEPLAWCGWHEDVVKDDIEDRQVLRFSLSTGGWSGNESLISAMRKNYVLWSLTWVQVRRGGHYIFEVKL